MLDERLWIYVLTNVIVISAIMLILFKLQENKIINLLKKSRKHYHKNENVKRVQESTAKNNNEDIKENNKKEDIDSFIDPIENN